MIPLAVLAAVLVRLGTVLRLPRIFVAQGRKATPLRMTSQLNPQTAGLIFLSVRDAHMSAGDLEDLLPVVFESLNDDEASSDSPSEGQFRFSVDPHASVSDNVKAALMILLENEGALRKLKEHADCWLYVAIWWFPAISVNAVIWLEPAVSTGLANLGLDLEVSVFPCSIDDEEDAARPDS